jgi:integrase
VASVKRRPDGRWRARYRDPSGREHARHFERKVDAQRWLDEQTAGIVTGQYVDPKAGRMTFRDYAESWRKSQIHSSGTAVSVEQQLRLHVYPSIGDFPIRAVRTSQVQALVRRMSETLAPGTVGVVYARVAAVFNAAVRDRQIATSPCVEVKRPSRPPASMLEVLTVEHVFALARAVPDRYRALILAGAGLGLRPGELFGLTIDRLDFLRRSVRVDQQLARIRGRGVELSGLKSATSYRAVPLPSSIGDELAAHISKWAPHAELGLIFTNERNAPIQQHPFAALWETARARACLPEWATPHDLRHHYASVLIRSGASVKVVQARLGHASARTTLDTYGHLFPDEEDRTRDAIDAAFENLADYSRTSEASTA